MRKRDALRLTAGTLLEIREHWRRDKAHHFRRGRVRHVTEAGGILVDDERGGSRWVPYHKAEVIGA